MHFKDFVNQYSVTGQPTGSIDEINRCLDGVSDVVSNPEEGIQETIAVLKEHGYNVPNFFGLDTEGDEIVLQLSDGYYIYIIYALNDEGRYDFYAEVVDEDGLEEIISGDDEED